MAVKIETALQPFIVPDFIREVGRVGLKQDGFQPSPVHALKDVPTQALSDMCDEFRAAVFAKAGKADPSLQE